jgi:hypothetical protein
LPDETTTVILSASSLLTALSMAPLPFAGPPRLRFATAGPDVWFLTT